MIVHVQVFSFLREYLTLDSSQRGELDVELPYKATLKDLLQALGIDRRIKQDIFAAEVSNVFQVMINSIAINDFAHPLSDGDSIVLFPPMAGG